MISYKDIEDITIKLQRDESINNRGNSLTLVTHVPRHFTRLL